MTVFTKEPKAKIWRIGENQFLTLNYSLAKSFCITYLKFWTRVEQGFDFAILAFCYDQSLTAYSIQVLVGSIFWGSPCTSLQVLINC